MANRCLADRTNAWTDTDHTCYTVYTAGSSGFLNILPVYMDHIFHPLLREEDFLTEVHHINGDGDDAGVVYSEMQGVEHKPSNMIYFDLIKQIYPGNSSYTVQTGGKLKELRESTTIEKVRAYHQKYYRPENTFITITGGIEPEMIFAALDPVERKLMEKQSAELLSEKPFTSPLQALDKDSESTIEFPSEEEDFGWVAMGWRIPGKLTDVFKDVHALSILGSYLTSTSISPMKKAFIEIPEPLATDIDVDVLMNAEAAISIDFENVPLDKMDVIEAKFKQTLEDVAKEGINMQRLHTIIERMVLTRKTNLENSPHLIVPDPAVLDLLYGGNKKDTLYSFLKEDEEEAAKNLISKPQSFWLELMNDTFSRPRALTKAYPSNDLNQELTANESKRLEIQRENLGPEGKAQAGERIERALASQILPPPEVLKSIPVADVNSIQFRKMIFYNHTTQRQPEGFDLQDIPFHFQLDDVNSQFVRFYVFLNTKDVPMEDKYFLVTLTELWLLSPLLKNGSIEAYESVLQKRSKTILSFYNDIGYKGSTFSPGSYSDLIMFFGEAEITNYEESIEILKDALFNIEYNMEKVKSLLQQALNSIPSMKLSSSSMNTVLFDNLYFNNRSTIYFTSVLRQQKFLQKLYDEITDNPGALMAKLHKLRRIILQPKNTFVQMAASLQRLTNLYEKPAQPWIDLFDSLENPKSGDLSQRFRTISEHHYIQHEPQLRHAIIEIPGSSSCYLKQSIPYDLQDWEEDEVATMRVMLQYLSDRMYDEIRGEGLTYGVSMSSSVTEGRIRVSFTRSSQLNEAYDKFREILDQHTNTSTGKILRGCVTSLRMLRVSHCSSF